MTSDRLDPGNDARFLGNLRAALAPDCLEVRAKKDFPHLFATADDEALLARIAGRNELDRIGLAAAFGENAKPLHLGVHTVTGLPDAAELITDIICSSSPEFGRERHIIQHLHPDIQALQLWKLLAEEPVTVHTAFAGDPDLREKTEASYIGITAADWGIAESATLVQLTAAGRPRSTSLVPSIHIALLRRRRILADLREAYALLRREAPNGSVVFISGPSKTADIEAHMVHGAHGPREMHVVILDIADESA